MFSYRQRMRVVSQTLQSFCGSAASWEGADLQMLARLGQPSKIKQWLAASLDKTLRLQLGPPASVRILSALTPRIGSPHQIAQDYED